MRGTLVRRTWTYDPAVYAEPRYRRACSYEAFIPDPITGIDIPLTGEDAGVVSEAEGAIRSLNATRAGGLAALARLLLRTESIASSKIEGMQVNARDLARAEAKVDTGARVGPTALEVLDNIDAMQLAVDDAAAATPFTVDEIVEIHRTLMTHAPNRVVAGVVRTEQNWIGGNNYNPCGADFVPPPPEDVDRLLSDLCAAVDEDLLPPLVHAAVVHAQFETIHPFADGNGRTGRALIQVVLRRRGLTPNYVPPVSVVLAAARDRYIRGLTHYRDGDLAAWIRHFAAAAAQASQLAAAYLAEVNALQQQWRAQLTEIAAPRADAAAWAVIDMLPAHPVVTVPVAAASIDRTRPAVNHAFSQLEQAGVLAPLSASARRNRAWEAAGLMALLARLDEGLAPPNRPAHRGAPAPPRRPPPQGGAH